MSLSKWKEAKNRLQSAIDYISLIGQTTDRSTLARREGAEATMGRLHALQVKTQLYFQSYNGATNYHGNIDFDVALAEVITKNFSALKDEAIALLVAQEREAAKAAEEEIRSMLAEIEAAK